MDVFALQASLKLNKADYEKALKEAEKEAKSFAKDIESTIGTTVNNITKNYDVTKNFVKNITDYSTTYKSVCKTIVHEAESTANAEIKANAQVMVESLKSAAKVEAAKISADQKAVAEAEKLALQREKYEERLAQQAIKEAEKQAREQARLAQQAAEEQRKAAETAWKNITTTVSTYVQSIGKTLSTLGSIAKTAFNAVYDAGKLAFSGIAGLASDAFSSFHDIATGAISGVTDLIGSATAALIDFGQQSVTVGMEFDKSMSQVAATLQTTIDEINNGSVSANFSFEDFSGSLREMAIELGENTKFTSSEVAEAINNMALAGYKQQDIADSIEEVLNMASAGNIGIAEAATYITKGGNALGLTPDEIKLLTDQIAVGASDSGSTVATLGQGIMKIGAQARTLKGGTTELVQILGLLSNAGENLTGTQGGNTLRNIIKNLQNPRSDAAAAHLERMGIQTYDSETGEFRSLQDIFAEFREYFVNNLGEDYENKQEYSEIMNDIFTAYAVTGATALIGTEPEEWEDLWNRLSDAEGAAAEMAAKQLDNLAGDVTLFNSALDAVKIRISDNLTPALRDFVQFSTEQMGRLSKAIKEGGIENGFETLSAVVGDTVAKINKMLPNIVKSATKTVKAFVSGIKNNADEIGDGLSQVLVTLSDAPVEILPDMVEGGMKVTTSLMDGMTKAMPKIIGNIPKLVKRVTRAIRDNASSLKESGKNLLESLFKSIEDNKADFSSAFSRLYDGVVVPAFNELFINLPDYISEKIGGLDTSKISDAVGKMLGKLDITSAVSSAGSLFQTVFTKAGEFLGSDDFNLAGIISSAVNLGNDIFNGALDILFGEDGLDWEKIGEGINSVVQNIDFNKIGSNINTLANGFLESTNTLLSEIDWQAVGNGAGTIINGIDYGGILHNIFSIIGTVIKNTPSLLKGVAEAVDASTANQLIAMANTLALGKGITTAISLWLKSEAAAVYFGNIAVNIGNSVKTALASKTATAAIAEGCGAAFAAVEVVAAVGTAIASWSIGTIIREAIGAETVDEFFEPWLEIWYAGLQPTLDDLEQGKENFKDAMYQIFVDPWKQAGEYLSNFVDDLKTGWEIYKEFGQKLYNFLHPNEAKTWGEDFTDSLSEGISGNYHKVTDAINTMNQEIADTTAHSHPKKGVLADDYTWMPDMMQLFADGINDNAYLVTDNVTSLTDKIKSLFTDNSEMSSTWGSDMVDNFISGINQKWNDAVNAVSSFAGMIAGYLHFSEPDVGALADFHTYAPDMIQLFADGIRQNAHIAETEVARLSGDIAESFRTPAYTGAYEYGVTSYPESSTPVGGVVVQNLTITFPEFNINSPEDIDRLTDAIRDSIAEKLNVKNIHDNRLGGASW